MVAVSDLSDVRSDLSKIQNSMGRIEERLDGLINSHRERAKRHDEMDARLRELENRQSNAAGKDAVRTGIISIVAAGVVTWIGRHLPIIIALAALIFTVSRSAAEELPHSRADSPGLVRPARGQTQAERDDIYPRQIPRQPGRAIPHLR